MEHNRKSKNSHICAQLNFNKGTKSIQQRKGNLFNNYYWKVIYLSAKTTEKNLDSLYPMQNLTLNGP